MKISIKFIFLLLTLLSACQFSAEKKHDAQSVNWVIGDQSFTETFGHPPTSSTKENLRISTHLAYVENILRKRDVSALSPELQKNRSKLLNLLHQYRLAGNYPKNYDYPDTRRPCFMDKDGNICAVGYLVEQTAGKQTVEQINSEYQYSYIENMDLPELNQWIENSGLTKEECAMIQPSYHHPPPENDNLSPKFGIASAILGGTNLALGTINAIEAGSGKHLQLTPYIGMVTGVGQIALGAISMGKYNTFGNYVTTDNDTKKILCFTNIGIGTGTLLLSGYNLWVNREQKEKKTAWNVYSFSTPDNRTGMGVSLSFRF